MTKEQKGAYNRYIDFISKYSIDPTKPLPHEDIFMTDYFLFLEAKVETLNIRMGIQKDIHTGDIAKLQAEIERLKGLPKEAHCPNCDGSGIQVGCDGQMEQCEWCFHRGEVIDTQTHGKEDGK